MKFFAYTEGPPIDRGLVTFAKHELRGHVAGSTALSPGTSTRNEFHGKTEIDDLDVSFVIQKDVFRLQITVNDTEIVKMSKYENQLGRNKIGLIGGQPNQNVNLLIFFFEKT